MGWRFYKRIRSLAKHRHGIALVYLSMLLPVLIGGGLLATEARRLFGLQTSLHEGADALALAGAAELNLRRAFGCPPSSIDQATNDINNLVQNQSRFGTNGRAKFSVSNVRFLSGLSARDHHDTTEARYVEVMAKPAKINIIFPVAYLCGAYNQASAVAVAALAVAVCQVTPLYICNPYKGLPTTVFDAAANPNFRRLEISLKKQGGATTQNRWGSFRQLQELDEV